VGCYILYSEEGPGWAAAPPSPLLAVLNVTAHLSTASVPNLYYVMWHWSLKGQLGESFNQQRLATATQQLNSSDLLRQR